MAKQWTKAQSAAISLRGKNLLISAAAGSGKTATLTERIIRKLTDKDEPADISRLLIVTFTRASAAELRARIFQALSEALEQTPDDRRLAEQLIRLGNAKISTIDSFYYDVIRENFSVLGLPHNLRIADETEIALLSRTVMQDCIAEAYEKDLDGFSRFTECFTNVRGMSRLADVLLSCYTKIASSPEGVEYLARCAERTEREAQGDYFSSRFGKIQQKKLLDVVTYYRDKLLLSKTYVTEKNTEDEIKFPPSLTYNLDFCHSLCSVLLDGGYDDAGKLISTYAPPADRKASYDACLVGMSDALAASKETTKLLQEKAKKSVSLSSESLKKQLLDTAHMTRILFSVLDTFQRKMDEEKMTRGICNFSDLRRYTLKLFVNPDGTPTPYAKQYGERFDEIYIDEYQDVDEVQDSIFAALSNGHNRFMVGDIKQSIYSFRGAEPDIFASYRMTYPPCSEDNTSDSALIMMSENFRCNAPVIDFTNRVCSYLFEAVADSIGYTSEDNLVYAKKSDREIADQPKVLVDVLVPDMTDGENDTPPRTPDAPRNAEEWRMAEGVHIARTIKDLLENGKKDDGTPIRAGEIAVLFRSRSMGTTVAKCLSDFGIPSVGGAEESYFENPEVLLILCVLNVIDNPQRDVYLAGALRSPLFSFTLDDLIRVRKTADTKRSLYDCLCVSAEAKTALAEKCRRFLEKLDEWRDLSLSLPVDRLVRRLMDDPLFLSTSLSQSEHILRFYEYARTFESGSFRGLNSFIEYIRQVIEEGKTLGQETLDIRDDAVNLLTIHKSKGLEFPVCILCGTSSTFNRMESRESLLYDHGVGIAMKLATGSGFARVDTPMRNAILENYYDKQTEEEMRVLYVALTRARERLIVTGYSKKPDDLVKKAAEAYLLSGRFAQSSAKSYLEWIMTALTPPCENPLYELRWIPTGAPEDPLLCSEFSYETAEETSSKGESNSALLRLIEDSFSFVYPHLSSTRLPAKLSISNLSPDFLDDEERSVNLFAEKKSSVPDFFLETEARHANAAERGTATHLFLQFCDFTLAKRNGVSEELARLVTEEFIPKNAEALVYHKELSAFLRSPLFSMILGARRIVREQRFHVRMSPLSFTSRPENKEALAEEMLAVQGVIDLLIFDGDGEITLVDYKTDRLTARELSDNEALRRTMQEHHGLQLSYYAHAVEILYGKAPKEILVYSTCAERTVPIERIPL